MSETEKTRSGRADDWFHVEWELDARGTAVSVRARPVDAWIYDAHGEAFGMSALEGGAPSGGTGDEGPVPIGPSTGVFSSYKRFHDLGPDERRSAEGGGIRVTV